MNTTNEQKQQQQQKKKKNNRKSLIAYKGHSLVYVVIYQDCQQTKWLPTVGDQL